MSVDIESKCPYCGYIQGDWKCVICIQCGAELESEVFNCAWDDESDMETEND